MKWMFSMAVLSCMCIRDFQCISAQPTLKGMLGRNISESLTFRASVVLPYSHQQTSNLSSTTSSKSSNGHGLTEGEVNRRRILVGGYLTLGATGLGLLFLLVTHVLDLCSKKFCKTRTCSNSSDVAYRVPRKRLRYNPASFENPA